MMQSYTDVRSATPQTPSSRSIMRVLLLTGALTSAGYFVTVLFIPDANRASIDLLLQFQPTNLVLYVAYFALGVYAGAHAELGNSRPQQAPAGLVQLAVLPKLGRTHVGVEAQPPRAEPRDEACAGEMGSLACTGFLYSGLDVRRGFAPPAVISKFVSSRSPACWLGRCSHK